MPSAKNPATPQAPPTVFVLFGASGDLAKRMVLPAFFTLHTRGLLPSKWRLVGTGRNDRPHEEFRQIVADSLKQFGDNPPARAVNEFSADLYFAGGEGSGEVPDSLKQVIDEARSALGNTAQLVFYLAVPPAAFGPVTKALQGSGLIDENTKIVYEKPYGTSARSFRALDRTVRGALDESQVYRIDHFLGKEATQQLHVLRFANELFAGIWNREHISSVQIDCPETLDVADRAEFYDATGAVLDMVVTHLFQVAAEVAMEPPASLHPDDLQAARESVIAKFRPIPASDFVLGQYDGYRSIPGVRRGSRTDTYAAARMFVDTPRWRGVPFLMRTGKMLASSAQTVSLTLRDPSGPVTGLPRDGNVLQFSLTGTGEVDVRMVTKQPGVGMDLDVATVAVPLAGLPQAEPLPPYVRLIHDVLTGDRSLFTRPDGLAKVWKVAEHMLGANANARPKPYRPGSWGPASAKALAAPDGWLVGQ